MRPHVSVIIVNYNSGALLARSLDALAQQTRLADRVVVVDNNSQDDSLDNLPELAGLEIFRADSNLGFAKANNLAASKIDDSDYLLLLNPDAFAEKGWLEALICAAEKNPQHHFFASKMLDDQSRDRYDGAGDVYHISGRPKRRYHGRLLKDIDESSCKMEVFSPCAGAAMYRLASFKEMTGFDETFFCYMEDVDLGFRMQLKGYTGLYVNDAIVYHIGSAISGKQSDFSVYYGHRNLLWTYFKNMPAPLLAITLPYHILLNIVSILLFSFRGKTKVILAAKKDALAGLPNIWAQRSKIQHEKKATNAYIWSQLDKSLLGFLFYQTDFQGHFFSFYKMISNGQLFIKAQLKNTTLAPLFYFAYSASYRYFYLFKQWLESPQNIIVINRMSKRRQGLLMSPGHVNWQVQRGNRRFQDDGQWPEIDLSVRTVNSEQWVTPFTQSVLQQNYPLKKIHLTFIDSGSSDKTLLLLDDFCQHYRQKFASIRVEAIPDSGFGAGHDFAIRQGQAKYLLVTCMNLEFTADAIIEALLMAQNDELQVASWEFRQQPFEHPKYYDPVTLETSWCSHVCVLLRRHAYEEVGGYEPEIYLYGGDVELSYRLRRFGYRLKYIPHALVSYHSDQSEGEQFSGLALTNAYIRLAYGHFYDFLAIMPLQIARLIKGGGYKGSRTDLFKGFKKIAYNSAYFGAKNEHNEKLSFPFHGFDYELKREGNCYEHAELTDALPLVSIVTRTYSGRQQWLKESIASVMNQTYANIEHVIVEDGGDSMRSMLDEITSAYAGSHYKLSYHSLAKVGRSRTGNKGMEIASGEWLMFLDDDDLVMPDHVAVLLSELLKDAELDAAYSLAWDVQTEVTNLSSDSYDEKIYAISPRYYQEFSQDELLEQNYIPIQSILFKRELFEQYGGFDEQIEYLEDWLLWIKYALNHKFKYVQKTTSLFRTPYSLAEQVKRKLQFDSVDVSTLFRAHS